jgi:predicted regulator of Ras-like GTPase activity (Roadblock/LC7/MglB family)
MKSKIAGLFRSFMGSTESPSRPVAASVPPPEPPAPPAMNARPPERMASAPAAFRPAESPSAETIQISLAPVVAALPMDLKAKLVSAPPAGKMIFVPVETVVSQLAFGAVKIPFGELRQLAAGYFINAPGEYDQRPVSLPLQEILSRINPMLLARQSAQKFEVAEEIAGPFSGRGRGVIFTAQPLRPGTSATPATPAPRSFSPPPPSTPPAAIVPPAAAPAPVNMPAREVKPAQPIVFTPPPELPASKPIAFTPRPATPMTAPIPFAAPDKPAENGTNGTNGHGNNGHVTNGSDALPTFKFTAAPVPPPVALAPTPPAAPVSPAEAQPAIAVALADLMENWPEEIRNEIAQSGLMRATVNLTFAAIEPGMKRGRVTMNWKNLRALAHPAAPASANDGLELDLPLKAIAPAFLAAQKNLTRSQSKLVVSAEIPNLFFGFPQPSTEPIAPPAPAPKPLPMSHSPLANEPRPVAVTSAAQQTAPQKTSDTDLIIAKPTGPIKTVETELFRRTPMPATDFLTRQTHPKDVVATAMKLPGVAGAVVAIADGLRVAGEVPADISADTVAAFLPQIYERINQGTRELRMGALNNVSFTVGNVPWKIFRVGSVYFAAFGRAGESLPKPQLASLAAGLDRKQPQ